MSHRPSTELYVGIKVRFNDRVTNWSKLRVLKQVILKHHQDIEGEVFPKRNRMKGLLCRGTTGWESPPL